MCVATGGNGSGKSEIGALKVARFLLGTPPPKPGTPFWIIGKSYELIGNISWGEKLSKFIHPRNIAWISWINKRRGWPSAVGLKNGWVLEMKGWESGRDAFQARSIGGAWFDEQFPEDIWHEVFARTREPGFRPIFVTLTPIDPDPFLEEKYHDLPADWSWSCFDLESNRKSRGGFLDDVWVDRFIEDTPEDFREVRIKGQFAGFLGAIYKSWRREIHVIDAFPNNVPPSEGLIVRGIDFGYNNPFVCLWAHRDNDGCWTIFDEHYESRALIDTHATAINARPKYLQGITHSWADPEDAQSRRELTVHNIHTDSAHKQVMAGIEEVQRHLIVKGNGLPKLRVTRNCVHTVREMAGYMWETNSTARANAKDEPRKKDDHCPDVVRYILFSMADDQATWLTPTQIGTTSMTDNYKNQLGYK